MRRPASGQSPYLPQMRVEPAHDTGSIIDHPWKGTYAVALLRIGHEHGLDAVLLQRGVKLLRLSWRRAAVECAADIEGGRPDAVRELHGAAGIVLPGQIRK